MEQGPAETGKGEPCPAELLSNLYFIAAGAIGNRATHLGVREADELSNRPRINFDLDNVHIGGRIFLQDDGRLTLLVYQLGAHASLSTAHWVIDEQGRVLHRTTSYDDAYNIRRAGDDQPVSSTTAAAAEEGKCISPPRWLVEMILKEILHQGEPPRRILPPGSLDAHLNLDPASRGTSESPDDIRKGARDRLLEAA